jgi:hypothetical protein
MSGTSSSCGLHHGKSLRARGEITITMIMSQTKHKKIKYKKQKKIF